MEKPKLDNARKLRGIFFFSRSGIWRAWRDHWRAQEKLKAPKEAAVPCTVGIRKRARMPQKTIEWEHRHQHRKQSMLVLLKLMWPQWRLESTVPRNHVDHILDKGFNPINHLMLVQKFIHYWKVFFTSYRSMTLDKEKRSFGQCF